MATRKSGCLTTIISGAVILGILLAIIIGAVTISNTNHFDVLGALKNAGVYIWDHKTFKSVAPEQLKNSQNSLSDVKSKAEATVNGVTSDLKSQFKGNKASTPNSSIAIAYGQTTDLEPTESLANSVLTASIQNRIGGVLTYDGHGSYYVNNDQSTLSSPKGSPWIKSGVLNSKGQLSESSAILSHDMAAKRVTTSIHWEPAGYHSISIQAPEYGNKLWNKGHSIGAALTSGWSGSNVSFSLPMTATKSGQWNASEYYANNVTTQTAWANQALDGQYGTKGYGQNYFEDLVRKEQVQHQSALIAYVVEPIYDGNNIIPSGNHIQARSSDGKLNINAFVPNVQMGVKIDYTSGKAQVVH